MDVEQAARLLGVELDTKATAGGKGDGLRRAA